MTTTTTSPKLLLALASLAAVLAAAVLAGSVATGPAAAASGKGTIVATAANAGQFTTLIALAKKAGLAGALSGAGPLTIMRVHVLGNVLGPIFVYATSLISVCMILAAGLSFLGLGTKPPEPEWGLMLNTLRTAIYVNPWVAALPGVMIFTVSICFNLLSDGMRSAMDVRS